MIDNIFEKNDGMYMKKSTENAVENYTRESAEANYGKLDYLKMIGRKARMKIRETLTLLYLITMPQPIE